MSTSSLMYKKASVDSSAVKDKDTMSQPPVIIVGAGITGLVLAQALKKHSVPFQVYERDPNPSYRGKGWGITIHWALNSLLECLPQHLIDRLPEAYVDREATRNGENGNFLFFNLRTAEALWQVPPSKRIRMAREKFRRLLMEGIDIKVCIPTHNSTSLF